MGQQQRPKIQAGWQGWWTRIVLTILLKPSCVPLWLWDLGKALSFWGLCLCLKNGWEGEEANVTTCTSSTFQELGVRVAPPQLYTSRGDGLLEPSTKDILGVGF